MLTPSEDKRNFQQPKQNEETDFQMTVEMPHGRETLNSSQQSLESGVTGAKPFYPN